MNITTASWWARHFFRPKKIFESQGVLEVEYSLGGNSRYKIGDCIKTPMKSGKIAILRVCNIWTPRDPGDQHFYYYEFIRYTT